MERPRCLMLPPAAPLGRGGQMPQTPAALSGGHPHTSGAGNFKGVAPQKEATGRTSKLLHKSGNCISCQVVAVSHVACAQWCGAMDSRKHLAHPRTSASRGRQGAWWHGAATQADARVQAGADVLAESANDAPDCCACGTASNSVRADGSGCGASGGSIQAAAARRTAAATGSESRCRCALVRSRPRDRLAARLPRSSKSKTTGGRPPMT